jgi:hypothetical protein
MKIFRVNGPFEVPTEARVSTKMVAEDLSRFWDDCQELRTGIGCYVFAVRAGKGYTPLYVGKTTKSFEKECFTDHKIKHYNYAMTDYKKCTPVLFLIAYPTKKGKPNSAEIADLEDFLIQVGRTVNPRLRNIKGPKVPSWGIKGVLRGGQGKPNNCENLNNTPRS